MKEENMQTESELLILSAARLYSIGLDLDGAREALRSCVNNGVRFDSPLMIKAYENFRLLKEQFDALEREHIILLSEKN